MQVEFVNRRQPLDRLFNLIRAAAPTKRLVLLDSPAGMGKTELLIQACRELLQHAYRQQEAWKIIRLDFRDRYPRPCNNREDVLLEVARQICGDVRWSNIRDLIQTAGPDDQMLIQQAASIPMVDESRQVLLQAVSNIPPQDLDKIRSLFVTTFDHVDVHDLQQADGFAEAALQVSALTDFILQARHSLEQDVLPDNVLLVFDGLDAIGDEQMRNWVIGELALGLHDGLQDVFQRFFVIVAGRFVEPGLSREVKERYHAFDLDPFTPDIVQDLIRQYGDKQFNNQQTLVSRLARKLSQVCGGHPRVIKETASKLYQRPGHFTAQVTDPQRVGYWYDNPVIRQSLAERRSKAIDDIVGAASPQQRCLLELLSVFRKFNSATLETLISQIQSLQAPPQALHQHLGCLQGDIDELFEDLLETRLIWDGGFEIFCSDRIALSLMAAQIQEQKAGLFRLLNKWAVDIFADWVEGRFPDDPDTLRPVPGDYQGICVCEWLFHRLHLVESCGSVVEAVTVGQQVSQELGEILGHIVPLPGESIHRQRDRIRHRVERDQQINHQIWEIACENRGRYEAIRDQVLDTFRKNVQVTSIASKRMVGTQVAPKQIDLVQVHSKLRRYFSVSELRELCFDLHIEYDDLEGTRKRDKVRELVEYCDRHGFMLELLEACRKARPRVSWDNK